MLLDDLVEVIEVLRRRIADHGPTLSVSETRTRTALIDPLLQVLGWDAPDPSIVIPEYDVNNRRIDYALLGQNSLPAAIVEANPSSFESTRRAKALMFGCRQDLSRVHLGIKCK